MTVRRDLSLLEHQGVLRRVAGGATLVAAGLPFERRDAVGAPQKRAIAELAAAEAAGADVVALDAGTTVAGVAALLRGSTVVTHSLPVIETLARAPEPRLVAVGGHYQPDTRSFAGPFAEETLRGIRCDIAVLSATAVGLDGLWGTNVLDAAIKRLLARQSSKVVLLADADKLGKTSAVRIAALDCVDVLITDARADPDVLARFEAVGVDVRVAG
jgi:DeoR family fructose operon transcriptional repressor